MRNLRDRIQNEIEEILEEWVFEHLGLADGSWIDIAKEITDKVVVPLKIEDGYNDCKRDMREDLKAVVNMLEASTDRKKIANYIREYLIEEEK